ncbi:hypothetical protein [Salinivirga cyanobacteriivorans]
MKDTVLIEHISKLKVAIESYIEARIDLAKATLLEKISKAGTFFLTSFTLIMVVAAFLLLLAFAFSYWYAEAVGKIYTGFLIAAGSYMLIGLLAYLFRRKLFTDNIIKTIGKIVFSDKEK